MVECPDCGFVSHSGDFKIMKKKVEKNKTKAWWKCKQCGKEF